MRLLISAIYTILRRENEHQEIEHVIISEITSSVYTNNYTRAENKLKLILLWII